MGRRKEAVKPSKPDLSRKIMLRAGEAAQLLGVHVNTVRRWSDKGILRAYYIGSRGDRRFRRMELESFLRQRRRT
jgi:excisionase family DNA binding protein